MVNRVDGNNYYDYTKLKNVNVSDTGEKFSLDYKQEEMPPESKEKKDKALSEQDKRQTLQQNGVKLELSGSGRAASADMRQQKALDSHAGVGQSSFLETIQMAFTSFISAIKDFFHKIWYDPETPIDPAASAGTEDLSADSGKVSADSEKISAETGEISGQTEEISVETEDVSAISRGASAVTRNVSLTTENNATMDVLTAYRVHEERLNREIQPYLRSGDLNQVMNLLTDNGKKTIARNSSLLTYYDRNGRMIEPNASDKERILNGDRNTRKL